MAQRLRKLLIGFISLFLCANILADDSKQNQTLTKFISVADIHFNPFYDCTKSEKSCDIFNKLSNADSQNWHNIFEEFSTKNNSTYFEDTNYALLKSSLLELKEIKEKINPKFVVLLGDFLGHDFHKLFILYSEDKSSKAYEKFVKKAIQFLTQEFNNVFPDIDAYPVVGNNDSYSGDYKMIPRGNFFNETSITWARLIKNKTNQTSFQKDFPVAGYYSVNVPGNDSQKIIMLNTVLFSTRSVRKGIRQAALEELKWMHDELQYAMSHHQKVILGYHIPVGVDVYATMRNKFTALHEFWQPGYTTKFENELKEHGSAITAILSAHIHIDSLQLVAYSKLADIPVFITPSISPNYGNNPGFKIFIINIESFKVESIESYFYLLNQNPAAWSWKEQYSSYNPKSNSAPRLVRGIQGSQKHHS